VPRTSRASTRATGAPIHPALRREQDATLKDTAYVTLTLAFKGYQGVPRRGDLAKPRAHLQRIKALAVGRFGLTQAATKEQQGRLPSLTVTAFTRDPSRPRRSRAGPVRTEASTARGALLLRVQVATVGLTTRQVDPPSWVSSSDSVHLAANSKTRCKRLGHLTRTKNLGARKGSVRVWAQRYLEVSPPRFSHPRHHSSPRKRVGGIGREDTRRGQ